MNASPRGAGGEGAVANRLSINDKIITPKTIIVVGRIDVQRGTIAENEVAAT